MVPQRFDPAPYLAAVYDSIGLAYDNSNQVDQAMKYYRQAIEIYTRIQDLPRAARSWHHIAMGCQRRQDWTILQSAAKNMLQLYTHLADLNGQIAAWQYLAQASINQHRPAEMFEYLKLAVAVEKELGHPDLQRDETLLESFLADLRRKQVNARNRKTGGGHPLS